MAHGTQVDDPDVLAIRQLMRQELSLHWERGKQANWDAFAGTFLPGAALFPAARPVQPQTLGQFMQRMQGLQADETLAAFRVTPLECEVKVSGNVAVAFAACELLENESVVNREMNATVLVRENGAWRIAAQAWDVEAGKQMLPVGRGKPVDPAP